MEQEIIDTLKDAKDFIESFVQDDSDAIAHPAQSLCHTITALLIELKPTTPIDTDERDKEQEGISKGERLHDADLWFEQHKQTMRGVHAGEYLDKDDFFKFTNATDREYDQLKAENEKAWSWHNTVASKLEEVTADNEALKASNKDLVAYTEYVKRILAKGEKPMTYDAYK